MKWTKTSALTVLFFVLCTGNPLVSAAVSLDPSNDSAIPTEPVFGMEVHETEFDSSSDMNSDSIAALVEANSPLSATGLNPATPDVTHSDSAQLIVNKKHRQTFLVYNDQEEIKRVETYTFRSNGNVRSIRTDFVDPETNQVVAVHIERYRKNLLRTWKIWLATGPAGAAQFLLAGVRKFDSKTNIIKSWLSFDRDEAGKVERIFDKYPDGANKTILAFDERKHLISKQTFDPDPDDEIPPLGPVSGADRERGEFTVGDGPVPVSLPSRKKLRTRPLPHYKKYL